ncbi:S41 family peptidase [Shewanella donghaensis]|uniref:S41 family peptidase n=1 Tax=Shewanella donghaensis TaxID=238836 RepID=UPI0011835880|nr:S41 family peptidase [Shewanella donghaensis]
MKLRHSVSACLLALGLLSTSALAANSDHQGYYRAPALHDQTLVFTAEGDLWLSQLNQSSATRLTTQAAEEIDATISKDGNWVAYSANYDGATEVYVMPITGGVAKRVSFENSRVRLQGWTATGEILYATDNAHGPANYWVLKTVNPQTLALTNLPLADAIEGVIDDAGEYVYFTQFGLQTSGDNAKVYRGGALGEIWRFKLGSKQEAQKLTASHQGSVRLPMLWQKRVYFISDQSGNDNIWSMGLDGNGIKQHTEFSDWKVRDAQLNDGRVVFQHGADIKVFSINDDSTALLDINLTSDYPHRREHWVKDPMTFATSIELAATGDKAVITARSHVAVASHDGSRLVQIQSPANARIRNASLSVDGNWVYGISDASGEQEIWQFPADGSAGAKQLTKDGSTLRTSIHLSPDGRFIAHDDYDGNVWLLDIKKSKNTKIITNGEGLGEYPDIVWSGDSQFIALTKFEMGQQRPQIVLYSVAGDKAQAITTDKYESYSPSFSPDGQWLYFLSSRHFDATPGSPWGDRNMGPIFDKRTQVFAIALTDKAVFPFVKPTELNSSMIADAKEFSSNASKDQKVKVDWNNISLRLWQVPVSSGNFSSLSVAKDKLYLLDKTADKSSLKLIKFDRLSPEISEFSADISAYQLSADGENLLLRKQSNPNELHIVAAGDKIPAELKNTKLDTAQWQLAISPMQEWQQIFEDAWLMHRDSFFDKDMRGVDWREVKQKYQPLLARLTDRNELNDIFKQMMGELNSLHSQVRGGDIAKNETAKGASLGARLSQTSKGIVIKHIYRNDPELPTQTSPLARIEVDAVEGDIIEAINGLPITNIAQVTQLLRNQTNKQVLLDLKRGKERHQTIVVPHDNRTDAKLRYLDWVTTNADKVTEASKGNIGYLHLYAMGSGDIESFAREFYANYDKDGLIIDVRRNRGGNIDSWIIEKLLRRAWAFWQPTHGSANTNMQQTFRGHLVVLTDQMTYSDGETFAAGIKALGLAPLIGKQTAGAGVWLSGRNSLTDKGMARVAEYPQYAIDGSWIVEGHGVEPDIEVNNLPFATFSGKDAQLETAISYLKDEMAQKPIAPLKAKPIAATGFAADTKAQ